ncbi:hypothetical protein GGQ92_003209 [Gracilibacillus halotolerans]|uniref:Uncharacterized protein n=1 Tax=Gracilibacillus halotolerans TaxID=74386 RepID=A0A841RTV9_9BACI|nr:hypothetical protein [Gracilibacillus halotolerans]MBB6514384.1 hypothetical protein [Gracilibacillus halotolerans]
MEIRLLEKGYKNSEELYHDFINDRIDPSNAYFSNEVVEIKNAPDFPIYMAKLSGEEVKNAFLEAFHTIAESYLDTERDLILDERFWHSLLIQEKRDYLLEKYPQIHTGINEFRKIVVKKFDWENYIYKVILGAQYITDNISGETERERYYHLIIDNLDVYNYLIKYELFRNDQFIINILDIIDELDISKLAKAKIKGREDLGDDERYGRRVLFEFNKSYPVVMAPMLEKEELKKLFITYLNYYYDVTTIIPKEEIPTELLNESEDQEEDSSDDIAPMLSDMVDKVEHRTGEVTFDHTDDKSQVAEVQVSTLVKENHLQDEKVQTDPLLTYLEKVDLSYIDRRDKGGFLWVIGDRSIRRHLNPLKQEGIKYKYKPIGSKVTANRPAWLFYD